MVVHGVAEYVIVNGRVCVDDGELKPVQGFGHYVPTPTFPPFIYSKVY
jgi:dihydropyrimidinase